VEPTCLGPQRIKRLFQRGAPSPPDRARAAARWSGRTINCPRW
jgi:hypothetical protein